MKLTQGIGKVNDQAILTPRNPLDVGAELTLFAKHARLGIYRSPSYWSTRNRSIDKHPSGPQKQ